MLDYLLVYAAGCITGGIVIALVYHNNLIKANALVGKANVAATQVVSDATKVIADTKAAAATVTKVV
jgi:hypothetical protein